MIVWPVALASEWSRAICTQLSSTGLATWRRLIVFWVARLDAAGDHERRTWDCKSGSRRTCVCKSGGIRCLLGDEVKVLACISVFHHLKCCDRGDVRRPIFGGLWADPKRIPL